MTCKSGSPSGAQDVCKFLTFEWNESTEPTITDSSVSPDTAVLFMVITDTKCTIANAGTLQISVISLTSFGTFLHLLQRTVFHK